MIKILFRHIGNNNNFLSLAGQIIFSVLGFISFVAVARSFNKLEFGEWILYITASSFIEMIRFGLTRTAVIRFLSGANSKERHRIIGANYQMGIGITLLCSLLIWLLYFLFPGMIKDSGFSYFFIWYPFLAIVNLPFNNALTILQADLKFKTLLGLRSFNIGAFVLLIVLNLFFFQWEITELILLHIIINLISSILCILLGWDGLRYLTKGDLSTNKELFHFGKYATGTVIGTNLLKSADTFIIGLSLSLGPSAVALYSIPIKLTELLEVPIRSYSATLLPKLSKASIEKDVDYLKKEFHRYTGFLSIAFIPICLVGFVFAEELVVMMAGEEYVSSSDIFRIFCIYSLLLPLEKFSGIALDSINKPQQNFRKIIWMSLINIIGDIIAVFVFHSLLLTSFVTVLMTFAGVIAGTRYLNRHLPIHPKAFITEGFKYYRETYQSIRNISNSQNRQ